MLRFLRATRPDCLKVFDINLRQHYYSREVLEESLQLADILKINDEEIRTVAGLFGLSDDDTAYLRGDSLADAQRLASDTAAYVCSRKGAMPV